MRGATRSGAALSLLSAVLWATPARADGSYPDPRQILLPADRPDQIVLGTNFGLFFSEDGGDSWLFSCEHALSACADTYTGCAGPYLLGALPSHRIFAITATAGLIYSDDDSCTWNAAGGTMAAVLPYAFTVDPSNSQQVYVIGVPRKNLGAGDSIYVSDDGGLTFGNPVFTAQPGNAVLTVLVSPSHPSTVFASMLSTPESHPILLKSTDSGQHFEVAADLVDSLGANPFELLAIDPTDENRMYVRILGISAEILGISKDGGQTFVQAVSIPGKLNAFLKLASGTILVGGTAGIAPVGYRSKDDAQTFEPWAGAPRVHALAERNGKLFVAGNNFDDGYAIAESDDEGVHLTPLTGFQQVQGVKSCVANLCGERCAYYAGINLWPKSVCGPDSDTVDADVGAGGSPGEGGTAGADADDAGTDSADAADAGLPSAEATDDQPTGSPSAGGCACGAGRGRPVSWTSLLLLGSLLSIRRRMRHGFRGVTAAL